MKSGTRCEAVRLEGDRTVDPVIIVTKNPATVANTMCTSTSNCWGKSLLFAAVAEG